MLCRAKLSLVHSMCRYSSASDPTADTVELMTASQALPEECSDMCLMATTGTSSSAVTLKCAPLQAPVVFQGLGASVAPRSSLVSTGLHDCLFDTLQMLLTCAALPFWTPPLSVTAHRLILGKSRRARERKSATSEPLQKEESKRCMVADNLPDTKHHT